jgi:probable HAF family extracellular repeat protein
MPRAMLLLTALAVGSFFGAAIPIPAQAAPHPPSYTITPIPLLPGFNAMNPQAFNNNGDVVGTASNTSVNPAIEHVFLYQRGKITDLGTLGTPIGINVFDEIVGNGYLYLGGHVTRPPTGGFFTALNDVGQVVGVMSTSMNVYSAVSSFLRQPNGTIVTLPTLQGAVIYPTAINILGEIIGSCFLPTIGSIQGVIIRGQNVMDIGSLGGFYTTLLSINLWGQVVGNSQVGDAELQDDAELNGILYSGGRLTDLNKTPSGSGAMAINDFGVIVGFEGGYLASYAFPTVSINGTTYYLNQITTNNVGGDYLQIPIAINDLGQILTNTYYSFPDGSGGGPYVLLTPVK